MPRDIQRFKQKVRDDIKTTLDGVRAALDIVDDVGDLIFHVLGRSRLSPSSSATQPTPEDSLLVGGNVCQRDIDQLMGNLARTHPKTWQEMSARLVLYQLTDGDVESECTQCRRPASRSRSKVRGSPFYAVACYRPHQHARDDWRSAVSPATLCDRCTSTMPYFDYEKSDKHSRSHDKGRDRSRHGESETVGANTSQSSGSPKQVRFADDVTYASSGAGSRGSTRSRHHE
ncbi:hypothetical protein Q5752_005604 [Cryptotrichosporon argae]